MKLYISEFSRIGVDMGNLAVPVPMVPAISEQFVEIGLKSVQVEKFRDQTRLIMVRAEAACHLAFGENPEASPELHGMGAGETRFYGVTPGVRMAVVGDH